MNGRRIKSILTFALIGGACAIAVSSAAARSEAQEAEALAITSTLDGKKVLPHRIRWIGRPNLTAAKVSKVEFLIDGKVRWTERQAPYVYAADDNGRNQGYLVTTWLAARAHRFTVRVTAKNGTVGTHTVTARVVAAPAPPRALAGTWERTIDTTNAPKPGTAGNPTETFTPPGNYMLTFERRWARDKFPGSFVFPQSNKTGAGFIFLNDYTADATRVHVVGEVIFHQLSERLAEGGAWCFNSGPPADYTWSVAGDTLTLAPVSGKDRCAIRGFIWTGDWTRLG